MGILSAAGVTEAEIRRGEVRLPPRAARIEPKPDEWPSGSRPTLTWSAANAATSISGSTRKAPWQNPDMLFLGADYVQSNSSTTGYSGCIESAPITTPNQVHRGRIEFCTDADQFELFVQCTVTSSMRTRVWVDGRPVTWAVEAGLGSGASTQRLLVQFSARANRTITFEWGYARFLGVVLHPTSTMWRPVRDAPPRVCLQGDSYSEGAGGQWVWDGWGQWLGRYLGWDVMPIAVGSTGYIAAPAPKVAYIDRVADIPTTNLSAIILAGGYNDSAGFDATAFQTAVQNLHEAIRVARPRVGIIQFGPFWPIGITSTGTPTAMRDAIVAATAVTNTAHPGVVLGGLPTVGVVVDPIYYPSGSAWITGSGRVGATAGNGNADRYITTDGVHPSADGHEYLGRRAAAELIRLGIA